LIAHVSAIFLVFDKSAIFSVTEATFRDIRQRFSRNVSYQFSWNFQSS